MRPRKLTAAQVAEILAVFAARAALPTNRELALKFGVSRQLISMICAVKCYRELCDTVSGFNGAQSPDPRRST
jgi:hypothetical protein